MTRGLDLLYKSFLVFFSWYNKHSVNPFLNNRKPPLLILGNLPWKVFNFCTRNHFLSDMIVVTVMIPKMNVFILTAAGGGGGHINNLPDSYNYTHTPTSDRYNWYPNQVEIMRLKLRIVWGVLKITFFHLLLGIPLHSSDRSWPSADQNGNKGNSALVIMTSLPEGF